MIRLLFSAALFFSSAAAYSGALPAYVVTPGAGAVFSATAGIIPQAVPVTFAPSAANDGVLTSRSIPVSVNTPQGVASGTVKTAGILSKPAAAALGKGLMRLNLAVQVGSVLYDVYQAANMTVDSAGVPTIASSAPTGFVDCMTGFSDAGAMNANVPAYCASKPDMVFGHTPIASNLSGVCPQLVFTGWSTGFNGYSRSCLLSAGAPAPAPVPASIAQKEAAIDTFANNSTTSVNALRLASDAYAAKIDLPNISVVGPQSPPVSILSPLVETSRSTDALGNVTKTLTQTEVVPSPDPLASLDSPIPVKILEHTQTQLNTAPSGSTIKTVSTAAPGVPADPALSPSTAQPPAQTDCDKNPDSIGCSQFGDADIPDFNLPGKNVKLTFVPTPLGNGGSCPAPKTFSYFGKTYSLSYAPLCTLVSTMRPLVLLLFSLASAYIFVGGLRNG